MNILDKFGTVSNQCFDAGVIVNAQGKQCGRVLVRYTKGQYGYNNESHVHLFGDVRPDTVKGSVYNKSGVFDILTAMGAKCYGYDGRLFVECEAGDNQQTIDSISSFNELTAFKIGRKQYKILWV